MRTVDLFCGCGGMSLGFMQAGCTVVAAFDNWARAIETYCANFAHGAMPLDLTNPEHSIETIRPLEPELIIGGPPCQDFSSAGKRNEDNGRGDLTVSYASIVAAIRPRYFVMENVDRIQKSQRLTRARALLKDAGYGLTEIVLDASRCGVPQRRKRYFMVGGLGQEDGFLATVLKEQLAPKSMTVADYFGESLDLEYYYRHPRSYARRGIFSVHEPSPTIRGVNRPIPKGYTLKHNDPVSTMEGVRPLTTTERSRIQTFPKEFAFLGSKTEIEQMIGNAVPVRLAGYVAKCLLEFAST